MDARSPCQLTARAQAYMYVTTYSQAGKPGTVPTWLWPHEDAIYFTTKRDSVKARRIRNNGRVTVHVGHQGRPGLRGARRVGGRPARSRGGAAGDYRRKYWLLVPLFMGRYIRKGLGRARPAC